MDEFYAHRSLPLDERIAQLEYWASRFSSRTPSRVGMAPSTAGGSLNGSTGGTSGGGGGVLAGDVTGPIASNQATNCVILTPGSDTRNQIQSTGDFIPLAVEAFAGQTHDLFVAYASDGTTKLTRLMSDGTISSPGVGTFSEHFGLASTAGGTSAVAFGNTAAASGNNSIALGRNSVASASDTICIGASGSASDNGAIAVGSASISSSSATVAIGVGAQATISFGVALGYLAKATNGSTVAIGHASQAAGNGSFALGDSAVSLGGFAIGIGYAATPAHPGAICVGAGAASTAANQCLLGGSLSSISSIYVGNGVTAAAPTSVVIQPTGGSGANIAGASLTVAGGQGTGSAVGGDLIFQSSYAGGAGSGLNALHEVGRLSQLGVVSLTQLTSVQDRTAFDLTPTFATATDASRKGRAVFNIYDTAAREALRLEASGSAAMLGVLGAAAIARPASYTLAGAATRTLPTVAGIDNLQPGSVYARQVDLAALEGVVRQLVVDLASTSGFGFLAAS